MSLTSPSHKEFGVMVRRHFRVPLYLPDKQIYRYLEKKGIISKHTKAHHEKADKE